MKKLLIAVLSLSVFTACENEPLEGFFPGTDGITNPGDGNPGGDETNPLQLDNYTFDVDTEIPFLGPITINTDFIFNANNKVSSLDVETIAFGFLGFAFSQWAGFTALLIIFGFLGTVVGRRVLMKIDEKRFKIALNVILTVLALRLIYAGGVDIWLGGPTTSG